MDVLAIIGFTLLLTSGADVTSNVSILGMLLQFAMGLTLLLPWLINAIEEEAE